MPVLERHMRCQGVNAGAMRTISEQRELVTSAVSERAVINGSLRPLNYPIRKLHILVCAGQSASYHGLPAA